MRDTKRNAQKDIHKCKSYLSNDGWDDDLTSIFLVYTKLETVSRYIRSTDFLGLEKQTISRLHKFKGKR